MSERQPEAVLVRGIGDVGSAVAVVLFRAGYRAALHAEAAPVVTRRGMAFADAVFDGSATLDGLSARRIAAAADLQRTWISGAIPVSTGSFDDLLRATPWRAVIDARMRKRSVPETQRGLVPLTIGLGPNFVAGQSVDLAIETSWGEQLGAVIESGAPRSLAGEPQALGGLARARFIYAPVAGRFATSRRIGEQVEQGTLVATLTGIDLSAPVAGIIRGLIHDGVEIAEGTKAIEIDPRGDPAAAFGLGERPKRIAEGVLAALERVRERV